MNSVWGAGRAGCRLAQEAALRRDTGTETQGCGDGARQVPGRERSGPSVMTSVCLPEMCQPGPPEPAVVASFGTGAFAVVTELRHGHSGGGWAPTQG